MQSVRQKLLNSIFKFILKDGDYITEKEVARKMLLMSGVASIGILILFSFGAISWYRGDYLLAELDYSIAVILIGLLFILRRSRNFAFCSYTAISVMTLFFWYLFMSGSGGGNSFLWLYTYPLFVFFLLGSRQGSRMVTLLFLPCLVFLFFDLTSSANNLYSLDVAIYFIPSFFTVALFAFMFEKNREQSRKFMLDAQAILEQRVMERTADLQHEIDVRKKNEEKLSCSEQRYRALFDSFGDGVSIVGEDGRFLEVNEELCHRLGYSRDELLQLTAHEINGPVSVGLVSCSLEELFRRGHDSAVFEGEHCCRNGELIDVEVRARIIFVNNDKVALCVSRDIREKKKTENEKNKLLEQLYLSQKMEAVGLMAGGVAHDLNNILSGVVTYPDLLLRQLPEGHALCGPLKIIKESGERAAAVVADLLTVARGVASQKETANLNVLIQEYLGSLEHQAFLACHSEIVCLTELDPDLMNIKCSDIHVKKCLMNLVFNGAEAVSGSGKVTVATRNQELDAEGADSLQLAPGQYVVAVVSDTGSGINDVDRCHIFEPFYTKKKMGRSGTGLGLAIVWNTMREHDGTVTVESSSEGSTFSLYFPVSSGPVGERGICVDIKQLKGRGETVLVVDDDAMQRDIAVKMLILLGYTPRAVASGEEAAATLEHDAADLILLDMLMGSGMNGCQTYAEIIKRHPGQRAVIASGFSESEDVIRAQQLGAGEFIKKPYTVEQLGLVIQKVLKS